MNATSHSSFPTLYWTIEIGAIDYISKTSPTRDKLDIYYGFVKLPLGPIIFESDLNKLGVPDIHDPTRGRVLKEKNRIILLLSNRYTNVIYAL